MSEREGRGCPEGAAGGAAANRRVPPSSPLVLWWFHTMNYTTNLAGVKVCRLE